MALKQFKNAINDYQYLVEQGSASLAVKFALADLLYEQQQFKKAIPVYRGIVDSNALVRSQYVGPSFDWHSVFKKRGKVSEAKQLLEDIKKPGQEMKDLEVTIQAAAAAVIEEYQPLKGTS